MTRSTEEVLTRQTGASQADLDLEREAMERESANEAAELARAAAAMEAQQLADEEVLKAQEDAEKLERAKKERRRAEQLAAQMNVTEEDEVEAYYREALESEALARELEIERKKAAQSELIGDAANKAQERVDRELDNQKDMLRQDAAMQESGLNQQEIRRANQARQVEEFASNAAAFKAAGNEQIEQGADEVQQQKRRRDRLQSSQIPRLHVECSRS